MKPEFLEGKLENLKQKISVIIPTHNRARTLEWCIVSLFKQKNVNLDEIVVVCDNSDEFTIKLVNNYKNKKKINFVLVKTDKRVGSSISRNIGVKKIKNEYFLFSDDDCIFSEYSLFGLLYSYLYLKNDGVKNIGAMHIPVYIRSFFPKGVISKSEIGKLDFGKSIITGNFDYFPFEYLNGAKNFIDTKKKIFSPFEIGHLKGIFLCKKSDYIEVGGFPDHAKVNILLHYGDEIHFTMRMKEKGLSSFINPDPKFGVLHLKYGLDCGYIRDSLPEELIQYIEESNNFVENSGWRVSSEKWYYSKIMGFYVLFGCYNNKAANNWKEKSFDDFVFSNERNFGSSLGKVIKDKEKREQIWRRAISNGAEILKNYYGKN